MITGHGGVLDLTDSAVFFRLTRYFFPWNQQRLPCSNTIVKGGRLRLCEAAPQVCGDNVESGLLRRYG
ncbi:hypothetical protein [Sinorhizobium fredii]|uniref:hypothetical protein n=1 Tax=Rhizobium fredii TaxID=380 RepID=UPI003B3A5A70